MAPDTKQDQIILVFQPLIFFETIWLFKDKDPGLAVFT